MKHFYIIRHGETEFNKNHRLQGRGIDASLNETGRQQAKAVANALKDVPITRVITSSLIRTIESAEPLIKLRKPEVESHSELDEMSFGNWEGKPFSEVWEPIKMLQARWTSGEITSQVPGGESPVAVYNRSSSKIFEIAENRNDEHIAVFIHGRLIRVLLSGLLGMGLQNMQQINHQNGSINHLSWDGTSFSALALNMVDHLESGQVFSIK